MLQSHHPAAAEVSEEATHSVITAIVAARARQNQTPNLCIAQHLERRLSVFKPAFASSWMLPHPFHVNVCHRSAELEKQLIMYPGAHSNARCTAPIDTGS